MAGTEEAMKLVSPLLLCLVATACSTSTTKRLQLPELRTVGSVDLSRYLGSWYEIANFPQSFQRGCTASTATYTPRADGEIDVLNRCRLNSLDGPEKAAHGRARVVDQATHAKLEVSFFRPFWGDYWIIDLGANYEYAVVGHPSRDYLWILSRTPAMAPEIYDGVVGRLAAQGYETKRLVRTAQPAAGAPPG
jgi:apolipoprotein D and lipocalin family protein